MLLKEPAAHTLIDGIGEEADEILGREALQVLGPRLCSRCALGATERSSKSKKMQEIS